MDGLLGVLLRLVHGAGASKLRHAGLSAEAVRAINAAKAAGLTVEAPPQ